jgi:hypothetical protein
MFERLCNLLTAAVYEPVAQNDIEMDDKTQGRIPVEEDVGDDSSLNVEDKDVMQQMGKKQQLAVRLLCSL